MTAHTYYAVLSAAWKIFRTTLDRGVDKDSAADCVVQLMNMAKAQPEALKPFATGLCNAMADELTRTVDGGKNSRLEAAETMWNINEPRIKQAVIEALKEGEFLCREQGSK